MPCTPAMLPPLTAWSVMTEYTMISGRDEISLCVWLFGWQTLEVFLLGQWVGNQPSTPAVLIVFLFIIFLTPWWNERTYARRPSCLSICEAEGHGVQIQGRSCCSRTRWVNRSLYRAGAFCSGSGRQKAGLDLEDERHSGVSKKRRLN